MSDPKATLLSCTRNPVETIYTVWQASKGEEQLMLPDALALKRNQDPDFKREVDALFLQILEQRIPIAEHVGFVFMLEDVSVSFREQMVRHRIGVCASPERMGLDIVPDLAKSGFWSQSMRIQSMGEFARKGQYRTADAVFQRPKAAALFEQAMASAERSYNALVEAGVPMEDARDVIPLGATHRISWSLNLAALLHIIGERSCWILQYGLWGPIIRGIVAELERKVDPLFRRVIAPPCVDKLTDTFNACVYRLENQRRIDGSDAHAPCPLYLVADCENHGRQPDGDLIGEVTGDQDTVDRIAGYAELWGHDPFRWSKPKGE